MDFASHVLNMIKSLKDILIWITTKYISLMLEHFTASVNGSRICAVLCVPFYLIESLGIKLQHGLKCVFNTTMADQMSHQFLHMLPTAIRIANAV